MAEGLVDNVMEKVEQFYLGDGDVNGEALFNDFAQSHHQVFADDFFTCEHPENKLE